MESRLNSAFSRTTHSPVDEKRYPTSLLFKESIYPKILLKTCYKKNICYSFSKGNKDVPLSKSLFTLKSVCSFSLVNNVLAIPKQIDICLHMNG